MDFIKEEDRVYCVNENNKLIAEISFPEIENGIFDINHTFVDESLRGQGIGKKLVEMAVKEIEAKNGKMVISCSYAKKILN